MIPKIIYVPVREQRFTTLGDWWEEESGRFVISISIMSDWRHEFCVLIHELTEWAICQAAGISTAACDEFDALWEGWIENGLVDIYKEAGFDRRCPYRRGHVWGARMERLFCFLLGANWRQYCAACDALMDEYQKSKLAPDLDLVTRAYYAE